MKDKALIYEVRKRLSVLEREHETMERDIESTRGFLAMLERNLANEMREGGYRTHAALVGDFVVDLLASYRFMHRRDLFERARIAGLFFGDEKDAEKQLASFSAMLSKESRVKSSGKMDGVWMLSSTDSVKQLSSGDVARKIFDGHGCPAPSLFNRKKEDPIVPFGHGHGHGSAVENGSLPTGGILGIK